MAQTLETVAYVFREFKDKFWKPGWKSMGASFQILETISLQMISLMMTRNYALATGNLTTSLKC